MGLPNLVFVSAMSEIPVTQEHGQCVSLMLLAANDNTPTRKPDKSRTENGRVHISGDHFLFSTDLLVRTEALSNSSQGSTITSPGFLENCS